MPTAMPTSTPMRTPSPITERAIALVADRRPIAERLGADMAGLVGDPDAFAVALAAGLRDLADPEYAAGQQRIAPGIGRVFGVRWPLLAAVSRGFRTATRRDRTGGLLYLCDRLFHEPELEMRWFSFGLLERLVVDDAERSWQLLRRAAREAGDWITVDSLAHPVGRGILREPYRWAELEQLVYSPSRWERRLVGSTIATIPFVDRRLGREPAVATRALSILGDLIGDAEPDVQKALSWALRSLTLVDAPAVADFASAQAEIARTTEDGLRAWVIRDMLPKMPPEMAAETRSHLDGIRRKPGARSTSRAAETAARSPICRSVRPSQNHP
jgi:3-methyladenine DNA glycosylase AlkD